MASNPRSLAVKYTLNSRESHAIFMLAVQLSGQGSAVLRHSTFVGIATVSCALVPARLPARPAQANRRAVDAAAAYRAGTEAYEARRYAAAARHLETAVRLRPAWPQALSALGAALAFSGRRAEGERCVRRALAAVPRYASGWFDLGLVLELEHRYRDAIAAYRRLLKVDPRSAWSWYGIACSYGRLGDAQAAAANLAQAMRLEPACRREALAERDFARVRASRAFRAVIQKE